MIVKCPVCEAEYDCTKGKYRCDCGAKFFVSEAGEVRAADPAAAQSPSDLNERTMKFDTGARAVDLDKTIPPRRHEEHDPAADVTLPGARDRKPDGRFVPGDVIMGRYEVLSELGQGGMGVVYKCFDETGGIEVALKALPPELSHNTLEMEDIRDNFQLVAKLVHQNIAISKQLERDNTNGNYYLIMECVEGEDLRRWIKRKRQEGGLKLDDVLPVVRQVAAALDYAHREGVIHRDIKPGNIMIDQAGNVKVLDFGLAAQIHTSMTRVSMAYHGTSGTGPYMAPEQWRGRAQGAAADQYALAVMTYEMLAGHLPFESTDASVLREAVLNDTPEPIPGIPDAAQNALSRALNKDPKARFDSCSDFATALAGGKSAWAKVGGYQRKRLVFIAAAVVAVLAVVAIVGVYCLSGRGVNRKGRGDGNGSSSTQEPTKKLSKMELYELQRRLAGQKDQLMKLDRDADTQTHILEFEKFFQIGSDALSHNDFDTASDAFQRAAREEQWLTDNEARRQEEKRRREEGNRRLAKEHRLAEKRRQEKARQEARRQFFSTGVLILPPDVKLELVKVEAGTFIIGSPSNEYGRSKNETQHQVTLTKDFYIGKTEVTQAQWDAIMDDNPSIYRGHDRPVANVSWNDAMAFCKRLNDSGNAPAGWKFTLPTEAQWEYAARGGSRSRGYKYSGSNDISRVAVYGFAVYPDPVASKKANELGLYDMSGNVEEWCLDWFEKGYAADPEFLTGNSGSEHVIRGGCCVRDGVGCRSASRFYRDPGFRDSSLGFRVVLVPVR